MTPDIAKDGGERRKSRRVVVEGVFLNFGFVMGIAELKDISVTGVGSEAPNSDVDVTRGQVLVFSIMDNDPLLHDLQARVVRMHKGVLGCEFLDLPDPKRNNLKHYVATKSFDIESQDSVQLEMDERTIQLKMKGYL